MTKPPRDALLGVHRRCWPALLLLGLLALHAAGAGAARIIHATPDDYQQHVSELGPGDRLVLAPGTYREGLVLDGVTGMPDSPVIIEGPEGGDPAVFHARRGANTIRLTDVGHVVIRNLILDGRGERVTAIRGEPRASFNHHVTLENLVIRGHGAAQGIVGIGSFAPAWGWVIRNNVIDGAGTGMYLGNSDGTRPFIGGLIEHNLVVNTIGYNMQIKHQLPRKPVPGMPTEPQQTVIRHNVFSKAEGGSSGQMARPNLLLGHWPLEGPGEHDRYLVYGNYFHRNPNEALMQAEGHVSIYNNVFYNPDGAAVRIQPHNHRPRNIDFLQNTVVASGTGLRLVGVEDGYRQQVKGNALFADRPLDFGSDAPDSLEHEDNILGSPDHAREVFEDPLPDAGVPVLSTLDAGALAIGSQGPWAGELPDGACDFEGRTRQRGLAGAYGVAGMPRWALALERKPLAAVADECTQPE